MDGHVEQKVSDELSKHKPLKFQYADARYGTWVSGPDLNASNFVKKIQLVVFSYASGHRVDP